MIGRYGFDARNLCNSEDFNYDERNKTIYSTKFGKRVKLSFLTAHSSKGLSADNVIIINAKDEMFGFPSQIEDDPVLRLVVSYDDSYNYAEERRLFYVALTRTKNRVFIITPENRPSEFIKELLNENKLYPNVVLKGNLNLESKRKIKNVCPICGYPMQRRMNKNYGLELWMCMNDQEICGFMTNDIRGGDLAIKKCDRCKDGYLIVKPGSNGKEPILGCTNYKSDKDKTGCNRIMSRDYYLKWIDDSIGNVDTSVGSFEQLRSDKIEQKEVHLPKMTEPKKLVIRKKRKIRNVNTTTTKVFHIEKEGFDVICDAAGNNLTDMKLLKKIRRWRYNKAKDQEIPSYVIFNNVTLVDLATRQPMTREELLSISGIGKKKVELYGEEIIKIIIEHDKQ